MTGPQETSVPEPLLYSVGRMICRITTSVMFDLKVYGLENVPKRGGVLLLSNHQSYLDPVVIGTRLSRPLSFLAKSELFTNPAFGWLIRNLNAFPIRQGAGDVGSVRETIRRLEEGHALVVFPEGSRTPDGNIQPLQPGFALIVRKAHVPIIPVTIVGAYEAWGRHRHYMHASPIEVHFGAPLPVAGLRPAEIVTMAQRVLDESFAQLRHRVQRTETS